MAEEKSPKSAALEQVQESARRLAYIQQRSTPGLHLERLREATKQLAEAQMRAIQAGATPSEIQEASEWEGLNTRNE